MKSTGNSFLIFLVTAGWFGIITGFIEGLILLLKQVTGGITGVSSAILWIAPIFNLCIFGVLGVGLFTLQHFIPRLPIRLFSIFLFSFMALSDWITSYFFQKINIMAIILLSIGISVEITRRFSKNQPRVDLLFQKTMVWLIALVVLVWIGIPI